MPEQVVVVPSSGIKRKASEDLVAEQAKKQAIVRSYVQLSDEIDAACVNTIRTLAAALPTVANSGHPGAPMGCAVIAHALWTYTMSYSPSNPQWWNRDRFVLSNGHGCALQYTLLHLTGYKISIDDLKQFRQLDSITPGHPEANLTPGIEVTTGPLGQGIAQAVGLAIAEEHMAAKFNTPDFKLFDNYTYCIMGDGCLQEGVGSEATAIAGYLGLGKLICFHDDNKITIDGSTDLSSADDPVKRFESYGWHVQVVEDGDTDLDGIRKAIEAAKATTDKPSYIGVKTTIGYGAKHQGTEKVHGAPLGVDDICQLRTQCGLPEEDLFAIAEKALAAFRGAGQAGDAKAAAWDAMYTKYKTEHPDQAADLERRFKRELPADFIDRLPKYTPDDKPNATRNLSEIALNAIAKFLPELVGGSADLTGSNKTALQGIPDFNRSCRAGQYVRFGIREHAMSAISNGLFAYGCLRSFDATFFNFYTYAWGAVRIGALSHFGVLHIATHDSIDLGEDGPTHQPIETAALCRATPNMLLIRPCDGNETSGAYAAWLQNSTRPTILALSRGNCPQLLGTSVAQVLKGAYVLSDFTGIGDKGKVCLASSGTEMQHAVAAADILRVEGFDVRVVSMPCWELFEEQDNEYRKSVIPSKCEAICAHMEPFASLGIARYFEEDASVFMNRWGASGPSKILMKRFGFTPEAWVEKIKAFAKTRNC